MSSGANASRTQVWLETLGDWSWPGRGAAGDGLPLPPAWVPAFPPAPVLAAAGGAGFPASQAEHRRGTAWRLLIGALLSALAAVCVALALKGPLTLDRLLGDAPARAPEPVAAAPASPPILEQPLPELVPVSEDAAGSSIA
ncbi:MAG TPA: hypothetical protein VGH93_03440, partial [Solirubrobacteraceae bacterium]